MPYVITYKLETPQHTTSRRFFSMLAAWRYLRPTAPDLSSADFRRLREGHPIKFADGYRLIRQYGYKRPDKVSHDQPKPIHE